MYNEHFIIDREAKVKAKFIMSFFYWQGVVDNGTWKAKYSKKSNETQIRYTLKNIIESSSQGAFKIVAYLICCCFDRLRHRGRSRFLLAM